MVFAAPLFLILAALAAPSLITGYFLILRLKKRKALRYPSLSLIKPALAKLTNIKRYIPPVLFFIGAMSLFIAIAKPESFIVLPSDEKTVILTVDVSGSMRATDIKPSRMEAEKEALKEFIIAQDTSTLVGIVAFSTSAFPVQIPTKNKGPLVEAVSRLEPIKFTAIGDGIIVSLHEIFPKIPLDEMMKPVNIGKGKYNNAAIVLMTDGQNNEDNIMPLDAARIAADHGVRIYTIAFGSGNTVVTLDGNQVTVGVDEETLKAVADLTGGTYQKATNALEIKDVYKKISSVIVSHRTKEELTFLFDAIGTIFIIAALVFSILL